MTEVAGGCRSTSILAKSGNSSAPTRGSAQLLDHRVMCRTEQDTIVTDNEWALLAWTDDRRTIEIDSPSRRFTSTSSARPFPHTRSEHRVEPGSYRLVVYDRGLRPRASVEYQIVPNMAVSQPNSRRDGPDVTVHSVTTDAAQGGPVTLVH